MFTVEENRIGVTPIANVDPGVLNASTNITYPSTPNKLGQIVRAVDPVFGEGEFIFLAGCAGTQIGSCVVWDGNFLTSLAAATPNQSRAIAFAMAPALAGQWGWYQIEGQVQALKDTSAAVNAGVSVGIVSAGAIGNTAAGLEILDAKSTNTATVLAATTVLPIYCDRPCLQGRIT